MEICECGSINKAANKLEISQPNLSVCIKNFEQDLGFAIFKRNNSGIQLTNEGKVFIKSAKKIVSELDTIGNIPSLFANKGNISISSTYSFDFMNLFLSRNIWIVPISLCFLLAMVYLIPHLNILKYRWKISS